MALVAVVDSLGRVIKTACPMAGHSAEVVVVIMILAAQPLLVVVQLKRNAHLVASGAKIRFLVQWFEKGLFVKIRFGLDHLAIDEPEQCVVALSKRVVHRFLDGVVGVTLCGVHFRDRMADRAGDAGMRGRVIACVKLGIIKSSTEKRYWVVATCTPARRLHVAITFKHFVPRFSNTKMIRLVVK